ncbi:MAG: hypothetical protein PHZ04_02615 [Patescibacteria group bacterium]|nr:hypothetical protein [Patescibacteria group bacterium]MDD5294604.1 hypothetical protein [Patescibacteria group bacterium]MDD5554637.1 hypothetical protein [Patescibacteria group bacterium]
MDNLKNRRILIFQQRAWGINIGHFLAKKLQAEGCRLAALTLKRTTHDFILNQKEVKYDLVINNDEIMSRPKDYLRGDNYSLKEICKALDIDSIWPIVSTLRNHVKCYKDKYYYSFKQNVPDEEIIDFVMAVYKYINEIFDKFNPEIIITPNFVSLPHIMFNLFAKKRGVRMTEFMDSKIKGYHIFSDSYQGNEGAFYDRVDALNNNSEETVNRDKAKRYIKEFRETFKKPDYLKETNIKQSIKQIIRHELSPFYHILLWYIKGPSKNVLESTGITVDYRPPKIILRDHYCNKRYKKFMDNFNYYPFEKIKKFVYFPLQFQPEASMDVTAPYFSNQIEIARLAAMSMPDDYVLAVKEHPAMVGLRPPSYIEKIARTVNIKLIDYRISSEDVLKRADLIISPNSTTIAEAAFLNKPAIQLGNLGTTLKLPNVFHHTDMTTLSAKIKEILKINLKTDEYERRLENFVAAVYDTGFYFNYFKAWEQGDEALDPLWQIYKKEIEKN